MPNYYIGWWWNLQVLFPKKSGKIPGQKPSPLGKALVPSLSQQLLPGHPAVVWLGVHQHNVRADFFDAAPGNDVVLMAPGNPQNPTWTGHHNGADVPLGNLNLNVGYEPQPLAVADADDLLALQVGKIHGHAHAPFAQRYARRAGNMRKRVESEEWRVKSEEWRGEG